MANDIAHREDSGWPDAAVIALFDDDEPMDVVAIEQADSAVKLHVGHAGNHTAGHDMADWPLHDLVI